MDEKQQRFMALYGEIKENLWRYCLFMARNRENARDLLGETINVAYAGFGGIREPKALLAWMLTVANRTFYRMKRKDRRYVTGGDEFDSLFSNDIDPETFADVSLLYDCLNKINPGEKEAIILFDIEGFNRAEVAKIQNVSEETVKSRLARGRKKLAKLMGAQNE